MIRWSRPQLAAVCALIVAGLGVTGCGGSSSGSAADQIRGTLHAAAQGLLDGNGQQVCYTLTQGAIDKLVSDSALGTESCAEIVHALSGDLAVTKKAQLRNIHFIYLHIHGNRATGEDSSGGTPDHFVRIDGHWYFASSSFG